MPFPPYSRRKFIKSSSLLATLPVLAKAAPVLNTLAPAASGAPLAWLNRHKSKSAVALTCGIPWPKGQVKANSGFELVNSKGEQLAQQTWPLAYWPDGSLKWTAHALPADIDASTGYSIKPGRTRLPEKPLTVTETDVTLTVNTGVITCTLAKSGSTLITDFTRDGKKTVTGGTLQLLIQDQADDSGELLIRKELFTGKTERLEIEQRGPMRAVIKITGTHATANRQLLPFVVRLYFDAGSDAVKLLHTIQYDANENKDFIKGLGISFDVALSDELYNRHIRFFNDGDKGLFGESVQTLTGLRRSPGRAVLDTQFQGKAVAQADLPASFAANLKYVPVFGDYTLFHGSSSGYSIKKRTGSKYSWIAAASGHRALGSVYLGGTKGGLMAGIKNFWQSFPAQLDVRNAGTTTGKINLWLWAPDAPAMDVRFYHDGMGEDTYAKQVTAMDITYEDYEPGFGTPNGVARTSEISLRILPATPTRADSAAFAADTQTPALLQCGNTYLNEQKVFGGNWSLPDLNHPAKAAIEKQLDHYFDYYKTQVENHDWYGFWNFGDFMHSYDNDRHTWKYDVGGFAWDNSELSTDLWLWYYYLKTQRTDVFLVAEAMTRHTGEVDVHHAGPYALLGSRHNVMHWGDSAKQLRISTAANRRFYYYLTADERVGDLLKEQVQGATALSRISPNRKGGGNGTPKVMVPSTIVQAGFGTDWGAIAAAWLTDWERTNSEQAKNRVINSMKTIGMQPNGFFSGGATLDTTTGKFEVSTRNTISVSHLNAVFGLTEIASELIALVNIPEFTAAWVKYCKMYNAPAAEQMKALGRSFSLNLGQGHSRLTAFAGWVEKDKTLQERAWKEFYEGREGIVPGNYSTKKITGPDVLKPIEEENLSTNGVAQWCLAAIQCLAYAGDAIPAK